MTLVDALVRQALAVADDGGDDLRASATTLLADYLGCVTAGLAEARSEPALEPAIEVIAAAGHQGDRDDLHWPTLTHPGSVVWPVVLALQASGDVDATARLRAATAGYEALTTLGRLFGLAHGPGLHTTATAGGAGAALTAAVALGLGHRQTVAAVSHALSMAGGTGQAVVERSGTLAFHRAAAAVLGVAAARLAARGLTASAAPVDGPRGLLAAWGADRDVALPAPQQALRHTSIRPYPVSGFLQSVVAAATTARSDVPAEPDSVEIDVNPIVAAATHESDPDPRWNLPAVVRDVWGGDVPVSVVEDPAAEVWSARLAVTTAGVCREYRITTPPGWRPTPELVAEKWRDLGGVRLGELATGLLDGHIDLREAFQVPFPVSVPKQFE